jgi:hypothetical protein
VTARNFDNIVRLIFLTTIFLLFCTGLQSAFGCQVQENLVYNPEIRVDSCHLVINQKKSTPCCQSEACHQTAPRQHDFGGPEYQNLHHDSYLLIHEARPLTPQLKVGVAFTTRNFKQPQLLVSQEKSPTPRQALHNLRTIVLLN